jgi:uncharacterized protein YbjT (DUF2867 family)
MPVFVTAADTALGRLVAQGLLREGGEVRVQVTGDGADLRAGGALVATGDLDDVGRMDAAMTDVHTVVHPVLACLAPSADRFEADVAAVAEAASGAGVRRLIVLSVPGAAAAAPDALRAACGRVEDVVADLALPTIVVRVLLVDLPPVRDAVASAGVTAAQRDRVVAPVRPADLVAGLVALDVARSSAAVGHAVFRADGPTMTLGGYLDRVGAGLVGRVWTPGTRVPLFADALAGPATCNDAGTADLWTFAGITPGPVGAA